MRKALLDAKGVLAIPLTPFRESDESIDYGVLEKEIEFINRSDVKGICTPMISSEFMTLSESEREEMIRVPFRLAREDYIKVANVAACNINTALRYLEAGEKAGADAVISTPPYCGDLDANGIFHYFGAIAEHTSLPVVIQNVGLPNTAQTPAQLLRLCESYPNIRWVKEEVVPPPLSIERLNSLRTDALEGIMSGYGGFYNLMDFANGAVGTIQACEFSDVTQRIWDLMYQGNERAARELHYLTLPMVQMELLYGPAFAKDMLVRRGIFKNRITRNKRAEISRAAVREFDRIWDLMEPLIENEGSAVRPAGREAMSAHRVAPRSAGKELYDAEGTF